MNVHQAAAKVIARSRRLGGCLIFDGWKDRDGYGRIEVDGKSTLAHRVVYQSANGPIDGVILLHACDTPACCELAHLIHGTQTENRADCVEKRRHAFGERHGIAKLTEADARRIKIGVESVRLLAQLLRVSETAVRDVRLGRSWRHV